MDTLITVAFVAVIILFQVFGAVAGRLLKRGQSGPEEKAPEAGGVLKTLVTRVSREIQMAMEQAAANQGKAPPAEYPEPEGLSASGKQQQDRRQTAVSRLPGERPTRIRPIVKKPAAPAAVEPAPEEQSLIDDIRQELLNDAVREMEIDDGSAPAASPAGYAASDLRQAVIWSEILAPPVALRK